MKQKRILLGVLALIAIALAGFVIWAAFPAGPDEEAMQALHSDEVVNVTLLPGQIIFRPAQGTVDVGLVFYPGGRVDYRSYAPPLRAIAAEGYWVALVSMPLNLAVFDPNRANAVIDAHPEIQHWAVGGHSLGGAMAAQVFISKGAGWVMGAPIEKRRPGGYTACFVLPHGWHP